ncbi:CYB protein, partial [Centropus unirufus]|nr:CYB protein [Centropus unirufus]
SLLHLAYLHKTRFNNPLGLSSNCDKKPLHPYFTLKDVVVFIVTPLFLTTLALF